MAPEPYTGLPRPPRSRPLLSSLDIILSDGYQFRILVIGKPGSGKSDLINAVFGVDAKALTRTSFRRTHVAFEFSPDEQNPRLLFHEFDICDEERIQLLEFVGSQTGSGVPLIDRVHTVWVCVGAEDDGSAIKEVLSIVNGNVPVMIVFTKFDETTIPMLRQLPVGRPGEDYSFDAQLGRAKERAQRYFDQVYRLKFSDTGIPAVCASMESHFRETICELTEETDRQIRKWLGSYSRVSGLVLAWSMAQRASRPINIQTCIDVGCFGLWRDLSCRDLVGRRTEQCVEAIHSDIVRIWNFNDPTKYLRSAQFKREMTHVVNDLVDPIISDDPPFLDIIGMEQSAPWINGVYRGNVLNVRCMMSYIVNLINILNDLFLRVVSVTEDDVQFAIEEFVGGDRRQKIHKAIHDFPLKDPRSEGEAVAEKIKQLVLETCDPPPLPDA
ncbi:hypothetical protein K474DRAFT_1775781 [Panus rudis PR-1116 ss-1]|nr:hypothetical protein K474DRAFT_1775781 [Panus rudis PR-1116 ss-1]